MSKKKKPDITIHNWKGVAFILFIVVVILGCFSAIIITLQLYRQFQKDKIFWEIIEREGLGSCEELSFFRGEHCKLHFIFNNQNQTLICNLALRYWKKDLINEGEICNFKIT